MEGDYEHKVRELSDEKEALGNEKVDKENENQGLRGEIGQLKDQVLNHVKFTSRVEPCGINRPLYSTGLTVR